MRGIPHPGLVILDARGTIRAKLFREGYKARDGSAELLAAAAAIH
jgi:hypothetical protein